MNFNWSNVRTINGSQNEGFEELVCQLAGREKIEGQKKFYRIGKPDAGKECFWEMNDGTMRGWQAKYFLSSLSSSQWSQIDRSVKETIDHHPTLTWYGIAMPIDRSDPRVKENKSFLTKWKEREAKWKAYAAKKGMTVEFESWGSYELITRLSKKENEGLRYFWFNQLELTDEWFERKNSESIHMLGSRYTPDLNFELPIAKIFYGLSRNHAFEEEFHSAYNALGNAYEGLHIHGNDNEVRELNRRLQTAFVAFGVLYETITFSGVALIPIADMKHWLDEMERANDALQSRFFALRQAADKDNPSSGYSYSRPYASELSELQKFSASLYDFTHFLSSTMVRLASYPVLLLTGPAGICKSHLLADVVQKRKAEGAVSLLLLGENFTTKEMPWTQILNNQLRLSVDEDVFLGAINAKAESVQQRIVVFIDAINEGEGRAVWQKRVLPFMQSFAPYPWLGLVVSIRESFVPLLTPKNEFAASSVSRVHHEGFADIEYEASLEFFKYYKITPPGTPLLHPEFQNPLFLKLFCSGLEKRGLHHVPEGYEGITTIVDFFIESVEMKLSQPDQLHYDENLKLVRNSLEKILDRLAETGEERLPYADAESIVSGVFHGKCLNPDLYLRRLISEGVLNTDIHWLEDGKHEEGVHFAYQRFHDHLFTAALLRHHLDAQNPEASFQQPELNKYVKDSEAADFHENIIEALAIQLPEQTGKELHEILPHLSKSYAVAYAFIDSLLWRKPETISRRSEVFLKRRAGKDEDLFHHFLNTAIGLATRQGYYFNADWLHNFLLKKSMPHRDFVWTTWLQDLYGPESGANSVKRLIDWAWQEELPGHLSNEATRLAATTLAWFLTSSNRYLRDGATKALVCLLQDRIDVLLQLLQQFENINDPYVYERLFAVAYGCAVRTTQKNQLVPLSEYVYKTIFTKRKVYPHILLRDYARAIIEYTQRNGYSPAVAQKKIEPPYKSDMPAEFPAVEQIDEWYKPEEEEERYGGERWGATAILSSMTTEYGRGTAHYGDFGRYTFENAFSDWNVDANGLSNYAVQRVFEMGYDPLTFTEFDSKQGSGRLSGHKERIGKKYQWLAFYELLAKVADNCALHDESDWEEKKVIDYQGPWYPFVRDIDPTMVIKHTNDKDVTEIKQPSWWMPSSYNDWSADRKGWILKDDDLPKPEEFLLRTDADGNEWLNLQVYPDWAQPKKPGAGRYSRLYQRIWYHITSLLVNAEDLLKIQTAFAQNSKFDFPERHEQGHIFSREFYWSKAWSFFQRYYYHGAERFELRHSRRGSIFASGLHTTQGFRWEKEVDCSKDSVISFLKPAAALIQELHPTRREGGFASDHGELTIIDPSVYEPGPSCMLVKKAYLTALLKAKNLKLVWFLTGEKQIIGSLSKEEIPPVKHSINGLYHLAEDGEIKGSKLSTIKNYNK